MQDFNTLAEYFEFYKAEDTRCDRIARVASSIHTLVGVARSACASVERMSEAGEYTQIAATLSHSLAAFQGGGAAQNVEKLCESLIADRIYEPDAFCEKVIQYCRDEMEWADSIGARDGYRMIRVMAERDERDDNVA